MTSKIEILATITANPAWSAGRIAEHLGCSDAFVRKVASNCLIRLPRSAYRTVKPKRIVFQKVRYAGKSDA